MQMNGVNREEKAFTVWIVQTSIDANNAMNVVSVTNSIFVWNVDFVKFAAGKMPKAKAAIVVNIVFLVLII